MNSVSLSHKLKTGRLEGEVDGLSMDGCWGMGHRGKMFIDEEKFCMERIK